MRQVLFDIVMKSSFQTMMFHNTEKTETRRGDAPLVLFVARTTIAKWLIEAGFAFLLHKLVFVVSLVS